jgi:hypothetical protein
MAEEIGKVECKTIWVLLECLEIKSTLYKLQKYNTAQWKHDVSKEIVSYKLRYL